MFNCKHCLRFGLFTTAENARKSFVHAVKHIQFCNNCPENIREKIAKANKVFRRDKDRPSFFHLLFQRLDSLDRDEIQRVQTQREIDIGALSPTKKRVLPSSKSGRRKKAKRIMSRLRQQVDPCSDRYCEETAFLFHDAPFSADQVDGEEAVDDVKHLPPPPPFPTEEDLPKNGSALWFLDPTKRLVLGNFSNATTVCNADRDFLGSMMERDDVTVVSEGLYVPGEKEMWSMKVSLFAVMLPAFVCA